VDEDKINNMAYIWFQSVLDALGKRLNYESISNLYGNSFAKDSAKVIQAANPLLKQGGGTGNSAQTLMAMPSKMTIIEGDAKTQKEQAAKTMGDISWFEDLLK
jgi:hypothetical protein